MKTTPLPPSPDQYLINDDRLDSGQWAHAFWITNFLPFLGFLAGLVLLPFWGWGWLELGLLVGMYLFTVIGLEVGFHRYFTHRSFDAPPWLVAFLGIGGSMCAQGPLIYWVANHRRHHRYSDKVGDPHSPILDRKGNSFRRKLMGLWHAHIGWQMNHDTPSTIHFAKDLLKNQQIFRLNQKYFLWVILGLILPALAGGLISWHWQGLVQGFIWGGLARIFILNQLTFSINSICHVYGHQAFATKEGSRNNIWLAIPSFGQSWHNNHHAFPYACYLNFNWWQIDLAGIVIKLFVWMDWIKNVKQPNAAQIQAKASGLNLKNDHL